MFNVKAASILNFLCDMKSNNQTKAQNVDLARGPTGGDLSSARETQANAPISASLAGDAASDCLARSRPTRPAAPRGGTARGPAALHYK